MQKRVLLILLILCLCISIGLFYYKYSKTNYDSITGYFSKVTGMPTDQFASSEEKCKCNPVMSTIVGEGEDREKKKTKCDEDTDCAKDEICNNEGFCGSPAKGGDGIGGGTFRGSTQNGFGNLDILVTGNEGNENCIINKKYCEGGDPEDTTRRTSKDCACYFSSRLINDAEKIQKSQDGQQLFFVNEISDIDCKNDCTSSGCGNSDENYMCGGFSQNIKYKDAPRPISIFTFRTSNDKSANFCEATLQKIYYSYIHCWATFYYCAMTPPPNGGVDSCPSKGQINKYLSNLDLESTDPNYNAGMDKCLSNLYAKEGLTCKDYLISVSHKKS